MVVDAIENLHFFLVKLPTTGISQNTHAADTTDDKKQQRAIRQHTTEPALCQAKEKCLTVAGKEDREKAERRQREREGREARERQREAEKCREKTEEDRGKTERRQISHFAVFLVGKRFLIRETVLDVSLKSCIDPDCQVCGLDKACHGRNFEVPFCKADGLCWPCQ